MQLGLFLALFFGGLGILLAGLGIMKWGNAQELKGRNSGNSKGAQ